MGGADSLHGEIVAPEDLCGAWVVDLAGDMPAEHREACACWLPRVFLDVEQVPHGYARLTALAESIAACITGAERDDGWPHPAEPPSRLYVQWSTEHRLGMVGDRLSGSEHPAVPPARIYIMCTQGLNRSGLFAGVLLRALGVSAADVLEAIRTRPGALNNRTFERLVIDWPNQELTK